MRRLRLTCRASVLLLTVLVAAGCVVEHTVVEITPSPYPISADVARASALGEFSMSTVLSVRLSTYGAEAGGGLVADASTPVWAVLLSGSYPGSCGGITLTPHTCGPPATTALVLIDARTEAFLQAQMPAPHGS